MWDASLSDEIAEEFSSLVELDWGDLRNGRRLSVHWTPDGYRDHVREDRRERDRWRKKVHGKAYNEARRAAYRGDAERLREMHREQYKLHRGVILERQKAYRDALYNDPEKLAKRRAAQAAWKRAKHAKMKALQKMHTP